MFTYVYLCLPIITYKIRLMQCVSYVYAYMYRYNVWIAPTLDAGQIRVAVGRLGAGIQGLAGGDEESY